eukprot:6206216-Pleurochrysis_carterae.AAC.2
MASSHLARGENSRSANGCLARWMCDQCSGLHIFAGWFSIWLATYFDGASREHAACSCAQLAKKVLLVKRDRHAHNKKNQMSSVNAELMQCCRQMQYGDAQLAAYAPGPSSSVT